MFIFQFRDFGSVMNLVGVEHNDVNKEFDNKITCKYTKKIRKTKMVDINNNSIQDELSLNDQDMNVCFTECNNCQKESKTEDQKSSKNSRKTKTGIIRSEKQVLRNERERGRKARLNTAFKVLRGALPLTTDTKNSHEAKYTQLEVLKLASKYISQLTEILERNDNVGDFL